MVFRVGFMRQWVCNDSWTNNNESLVLRGIPLRMWERIALPGWGLRDFEEKKTREKKKRGSKPHWVQTGLGKLLGTEFVLHITVGTSRPEQDLPQTKAKGKHGEVPEDTEKRASTGNGPPQTVLGQKLKPNDKIMTSPTTALRKDLVIMPRGKPNWSAGRLRSIMFLSSLCFRVGWRRLKQVLQRTGTVRYADIWRDKREKS